MPHFDAERWVLAMYLVEELNLDGLLTNVARVLVIQFHLLRQAHGLQELLILQRQKQ